MLFRSNVDADVVCGGGFTLRVTVTNEFGCEGECELTVTIDDTTDPTVSCPMDLDLECDDPLPPPYTNLADFLADGGMADDDCDDDLAFSLESETTTGTCPTVIERVYRVTDDCDNFAECTQTITVDDTTAPDITCPADVVVECEGDVPPIDPDSVTGRGTERLEGVEELRVADVGTEQRPVGGAAVRSRHEPPRVSAWVPSGRCGRVPSFRIVRSPTSAMAV